MMLYTTDNPGLDAEAYYGYCEHQQALWESRCCTCDICGKTLDPHYDETEWCYEDEDIHICKSCVEKNLKEVRKINPFFASMVEDALDTFYTTSPIPD